MRLACLEEGAPAGLRIEWFPALIRGSWPLDAEAYPPRREPLGLAALLDPFNEVLGLLNLGSVEVPIKKEIDTGFASCVRRALDAEKMLLFAVMPGCDAYDLVELAFRG